MKIASGILVPISGISATAFFHFNHSTLGIICVFVAFLFATIFLWLSIGDRNLEKKQDPKGREVLDAHGVATDEKTRLIIKAISDEANGFVTLADIVRYTALPLKRINKTLD